MLEVKEKARIATKTLKNLNIFPKEAEALSS
jgi:hypothetical protein